MPNARAMAFLLMVTVIFAAQNMSALADTEPCRSIQYERNAYTVCEVDIRKQTVRLYWKRPDGTPYAYLSALPRALEGEGGRLLFAANAGMFDPALEPGGALRGAGAGARASQYPLGLWQFSHEAERGFLPICRCSGRRRDTGISPGEVAGAAGDAIRSDAGDQRAPASALQPA